jgi:hypothetical protein
MTIPTVSLPHSPEHKFETRPGRYVYLLKSRWVGELMKQKERPLRDFEVDRMAGRLIQDGYSYRGRNMIF